MQENPPCELSGCFSTVLLFLLIPKSGDSLKEQTEKTDEVNSAFLKKKNQFQARWSSKQNISKEEEGMHVTSSKNRNIDIY